VRAQSDARNEWELAATEPENEWVTAAAPAPALAAQAPLVATGIAAPIPDLTPPAAEHCLDLLPVDDVDTLWLVSAHGGAGSSALGLVYDLPAVTRRWPVSRAGTHVVLVCRSNLAGLEAARSAAREWASDSLPDVHVHGLIIVPDVPGRVPKPLQQLADHVSGTVPHVWHAAWADELRTTPATPDLATRAWKSLTPQIQLIREQITNQRSIK
jgi:hypothetical protein